MKVLHVEDDPAIAELYGLALTALGRHEVTVRGDGESGLGAALSGSFDVVLLDLHLPVLGGRELLERLRQADVRPQPAVVVLTSDDDPSTHRALLAAGATACLCKMSTTPQDLVNHLAGAARNGAAGNGAAGNGAGAVQPERCSRTTMPRSPIS